MHLAMLYFSKTHPIVASILAENMCPKVSRRVLGSSLGSGVLSSQLRLERRKCISADIPRHVFRG